MLFDCPEAVMSAKKSSSPPKSNVLTQNFSAFDAKNYIYIRDIHKGSDSDNHMHKNRNRKLAHSGNIFRRTKIGTKSSKSMLVGENLKMLINERTFMSLPMGYQQQLLSLLPACDQIQSSGELFNQTLSSKALNNEFFSQSCAEWSERLSEGVFAIESRQQLKNEDREKMKMDEWKVKLFEANWGDKLSAQELDADAELHSASFNDDQNDVPCTIISKLKTAERSRSLLGTRNIVNDAAVCKSDCVPMNCLFSILPSSAAGTSSKSQSDMCIPALVPSVQNGLSVNAIHLDHSYANRAVTGASDELSSVVVPASSLPHGVIARLTLIRPALTDHSDQSVEHSSALGCLRPKFRSKYNVSSLASDISSCDLYKITKNRSRCKIQTQVINSHPCNLVAVPKKSWAASSVNSESCAEYATVTNCGRLPQVYRPERSLLPSNVDIFPARNISSLIDGCASKLFVQVPSKISVNHFNSDFMPDTNRLASAPSDFVAGVPDCSRRSIYVANHHRCPVSQSQAVCSDSTSSFCSESLRDVVSQFSLPKFELFQPCKRRVRVKLFTARQKCAPFVQLDFYKKTRRFDALLRKFLHTKTRHPICGVMKPCHL